MSEINTIKAIEIKKALIAISDFMEIDAQIIVNRICLYDKKLMSKFKNASDIWNEFDNADIVERGKMLGVTVIERKP
jgi:hypothetical protein